MKEAIILAGGFGTRLQSVIRDIPKPMSPIGGKPFLEFLLGQLVLSGFSRTVLSVGYRHEVIRHRFGDSFGVMQLDYCVEDTPLGTGGAIAKALQQTTANDVLVVNGDSILLASLERFYLFHRSRKAYDASVNPDNQARVAISIALKAEKNFDRYGSVTLIDDRIVRFEEKKPVAEGIFNAGLYFISQSVGNELADLPVPFSFEKEILEKQVFPLSGCVFHDYFIDIGVPEDYARAQTELLFAFQRYAKES